MVYVYLVRKLTMSQVDKNVVAMIHLNCCGKEKEVGHVPQNISRMVSLYLSLPHFQLELEVTGTVVVVMDLRFRFYGPENATQWLETRLTKIEEKLKESITYCLK